MTTPSPKEVVRRFLDHGATVAESFGLAPTGREATIDHVEMWRVEDGKIVEHWGGLGAAGQLFRALSAT